MSTTKILLGVDTEADDQWSAAARKTLTVENAREQRALEAEYREHPFFDGALGHEADDLHWTGLSQSVHAADSLLQHGGVPRQIHVHHHRRVLEVQADPARVG